MALYAIGCNELHICNRCCFKKTMFCCTMAVNAFLSIQSSITAFILVYIVAGCAIHAAVYEAFADLSYL